LTTRLARYTLSLGGAEVTAAEFGQRVLDVGAKRGKAVTARELAAKAHKHESTISTYRRMATVPKWLTDALDKIEKEVKR
jgi:hypothetical protein